jgi:steroid 5-alpha reductase family enzyme
MTGRRGPHAIALTALSTLWGLRLAAHLFRRWRTQGPDPRYEFLIGKVRSERGWNFAQASLRAVFALQAPLQFLVALPVQLGQTQQPQPFGLLAWAGTALALIGLLIETQADRQLARFKADPANAGRVLDTGLWRYSRWWGLFLIAADTGGLGVASIASPILLTLLLTRWSGVPIVEARMLRRRPDYETYVRRTSSFIPLPPKRG